MDPHLHRHGHWFTQVQWLQCHFNDRQLILEGNHPYCMFHRAVFGRVGQDLTRQSIHQTQDATGRYI